MNPTSNLILAIPGTQETQELPRNEVLEAIKRGEIGADHLVWSPSHNEWKQAAEHPELQMAPEDGPSLEQESTLAAADADLSGTVKHAFPEPREAEITDLGLPQETTPMRYSQNLNVSEGFPIFKVIFLVPFLVVIGVILLNYFMVDQPFANNLATTPFKEVSAYAHLGAFAQPNALVIHVLPTTKLNQDNFADFLAAIAKSTPPQPINQKPFDFVGLTYSWQSQYIFEGADWVTLGKMDGATSDEKKAFEIEHLEYVDGSPLVKNRKRDDPATVLVRQAKAWQALVTNFFPKPS